jgi:2-oxo-4-hydroxy-4-carboxy-5-ureidoimidazoline decarboxylase
MAAPNGLDLAALNALPDEQAERALLACCSSSRWAKGVSARRPFGTVDDLHEAADAELQSLTEDELDDALAGHPRIGETRPGQDGAWSRHEQSGLDGAHADTLDAIAQANVAYENRFGHVYLVCATGKSADELLALLHARLHNDPQTERAVVRDELAKINRIRLARLIGQEVPA